MRNASAILVSVLFLSGVFGCARHVALVPGPGAERPDPSADYAAASARGVEVSANGNLWPGREEIGTMVMPVKVTVRNGSGFPIAIDYDSFALVDSSGKQYAALPPSAIDGSIAELAGPYDSARGFYAPPYNSPFHPDLGPFSGGPYFYEPLYYDRFHGNRRRIELPTPEMLENALREGVLEDGGRAEGFLYFQRIDPDIAQVTFKAEMVDPRTEGVFAGIEIPFTVEKR